MGPQSRLMEGHIMGHTIEALQARAISNLARKHRNEMLELQDRHFTEMQALEVELFGQQQEAADPVKAYRDTIFTVTNPDGTSFRVVGWEGVNGHLPDRQRQELADAVHGSRTYFDGSGRSWNRTSPAMGAKATTYPVFTVEDKVGDRIEVNGLIEAGKYVSDNEVRRLSALGMGVGFGYLDNKGRIWRRKA